MTTWASPCNWKLRDWWPSYTRHMPCIALTTPGHPSPDEPRLLCCPAHMERAESKEGDEDRPQRIRSFCIPFFTVIIIKSRPKAASIKMPSPSLPSHAGDLAQYAVLYRPGNSGYGSMPGPRRIFLPLKTKLSSFSFFLNSSSLIPLSTLILW